MNRMRKCSSHLASLSRYLSARTVVLVQRVLQNPVVTRTIECEVALFSPVDAEILTQLCDQH